MSNRHKRVKAVIPLNASSAHSERAFLEERLKQVRQDCESAEKDFSERARKSTAIDISSQGKDMIGAASTLDGQWIAAIIGLESLRQVNADKNVRVRATEARVEDLRRQLEKLGGRYEGKVDHLS